MQKQKIEIGNKKREHVISLDEKKISIWDTIFCCKVKENIVLII